MKPKASLAILILIFSAIALVAQSIPTVHASIANDTSCTKWVSGGNPSCYLNHAANALVVIVEGGPAQTPYTPSVTVGGESASLLTWILDSNTDTHHGVWYIFRPIAANESVVFSLYDEFVKTLIAMSFTGTVTSPPYFDGYTETYDAFTESGWVNATSPSQGGGDRRIIQSILSSYADSTWSVSSWAPLGTGQVEIASVQHTSGSYLQRGAQEANYRDSDTGGINMGVYVTLNENIAFSFHEIVFSIIPLVSSTLTITASTTQTTSVTNTQTGTVTQTQTSGTVTTTVGAGATATATDTSTSTITSVHTNVVTSTSTILTGVATKTNILWTYIQSDMPLVIYAVAALMVLFPTFILLRKEKTITALLLGLNAGIVWAVGSGVLGINALLLLVGTALVALFFRFRGGGT